MTRERPALAAATLPVLVVVAALHVSGPSSKHPRELDWGLAAASLVMAAMAVIALRP